MVPYDKRSGKIWYNSELLDWADAKIHVLNHGLHYASCVFEGERVYDGKIFKLEEHTERLFHSASRMGFKIPYSQESINKSCEEIVSIQNEIIELEDELSNSTKPSKIEEIQTQLELKKSLQRFMVWKQRSGIHKNFLGLVML